MAPRPNSGTTPENPFAEADPGTRIDLDVGPEGEALGDLDRIVQEAGPDADWAVSVFRKTEDGLKWGYCGRLSLAGFSVDSLPKKFGGGDFLIRIMNKKNRVSKTISVKFDPDVFPRQVSPAPSVSAGAGAAPDLQTQLLVKLSERLERQQEQNSHFLQTLITAVVGRGSAPAGPSLTEMVQGVAALKTLAGPDASSTPPNVILEAMRGALELRRESAESTEGEGDPLYRLLEKVAPAILEAMNRRPVPVPTPAKTALPSGNPPPPQPGGVPRNGEGVTMIAPEVQPYLWIRKYTPKLLEWAQQGMPAENAAAVIDNMIPEPHQHLLDDFIEMEPGRRHSIFVQLDARLQPYRTYLDEICVALMEEPVDAGEAASGAVED